jgi:hypothetical protein
MFEYGIIIALLCLIIFIIYLTINSAPFNKKICLLAIIKNEAMVIDEWINHYIWQGIDHFYIIDNGSTDNIKDILNPYIVNGKISYFYRGEQHRQVKHYNEIFYYHIKNDCGWLIICDIDEYIYYRGKKVLKDYIDSLDQSKISNIVLNWKMFGSGGHINQPASIRKSFLLRKYELDENVKSIINIRFTNRLDIHKHIYSGGISINNPIELALNHYAIMSREYFAKIKMTRGDVNYNKHNNIRNWNYFDKYDYFEEYDSELCDLVISYLKLYKKNKLSLLMDV